MLIFFGTRLYGGIEHVGRAHVATRFFHIMFFPILPLGSVVVAANGTRIATQVVKRSVAVAYLRAYGLLLTALAAAPCVMGTASIAYFNELRLGYFLVALFGLALTILALALTIAALTTMGRLTAEEMSKRLTFAQFSGFAAHPRHLGMRAVDLLDELQLQTNPDEQTPNAAAWAISWIEEAFSVLPEDQQLWRAREQLRWTRLGARSEATS